MPALREKIISIICEEWQKAEDRETPLDAATISEQLGQAGVIVSDAEVQLELERLVGHEQIILEAEPGRVGLPVIVWVNPELCL
jgi:hypothetical protein